MKHTCKIKPAKLIRKMTAKEKEEQAERFLGKVEKKAQGLEKKAMSSKEAIKEAYFDILVEGGWDHYALGESIDELKRKNRKKE